MITTPMAFEDAIQYVLDKDSIGDRQWDSKMWQAQGGDIKERAFFSAQIENARFLDRAHGLIFDYLAKVRDDVTTPRGEKTTALRIGGRADFVRLMREFMVAEGMATPEQIEKAKQTSVQDIKAEARLRLIFDTQVRQAYAYGQWKQGQSPGVKDEYPAAKLVRERGVAVPRARHQANIGQIRMKDDAWWPNFINAADIGGFEVPWGPYGFNSGCEQIDATLAEYQAQNPTAEIPPPTPEKDQPGLNENLSASVKTLDPAIKERLLLSLRSKGADRAKIVEENNRISLEREAQGKGIFDP